MLDFIYHITLNYFEITFFGMKKYLKRLSLHIRNVVMDVITNAFH